MADVAVFHASIMAGGGAEAVGVNAMVALANGHHEVTLYALDDVDPDVLEDRHGTTLPADLAIRRPARVRARAVDAFAAAARGLVGITDLPLLRRAVVERGAAAAIGDNHDLVVSTDGPFATPGRVVQFVHFPYYDETAMRRFDTRFSEPLYPTYHRVCRTLRPVNRAQHQGSTMLTNSQWTADVVEGACGRRPEVVNPPVRVEEFDPPSPSEMENGFVCIGRVHPLKRQHVAVEIIDGLRARGVDTHLHVVGGAGSDEYAERIRSLAAERPHLHVEGEVSRSRLVELIEQHRFGIHARKYEHFGIAIAEMMAGGTIPFVPDSGGQTEVIPDPDSLAYSSIKDAVQKIERVATSEDRRSSLGRRVLERSRHFSQDRFEDELLEYVEATLEEDGSSNRANRGVKGPHRDF